MNHDEEFEGFETPLILMVDEVLARIRRTPRFPPDISSELPLSTCPETEAQPATS
jgi:hypothetical protein